LQIGEESDVLTDVDGVLVIKRAGYFDNRVVRAYDVSSLLKMPSWRSSSDLRDGRPSQ